MPRGGKREKAGRPNDWSSKVKFKDTTTIRVPVYIKDEVLKLAHRLDEGENLDLSASLKDKEIQDIKSELLLIKSEKQQMLEQVEKTTLDLVTKYKVAKSRIEELEKENYRLQNLENVEQLLFDDCLAHLTNLINQFIEKSRKEIKGLRPLEVANKTHKILSELQKIISDKQLDFEIVTNSKFQADKLVSSSSEKDIEIVTNSKVDLQIDLLNTDNNEKSLDIKPLTSIELSRRFNKKDGFVKGLKFSHKNRLEELANLLKQYDPQGVSWQFSDVDQKYHPVIEPKN